MKLKCPKCEAVFNVDDSKIPDKGIYGTCPKCKERFFVKKEDSFQETLSEPETLLCPNCQQERKAGDIECPKCGIIYEKYDPRVKVKQPGKAEFIKTPKVDKIEIPKEGAKKSRATLLTIVACAVLFVLSTITAVIGFMSNGGSSDSPSIIIISLLLLAFVVLAIYAYKMTKKTKTYEERFSKIVDVDKEFTKVTSEKQKIEKTIEELRTSYKAKKIIFNDLVKEAAIYDEEIELAELGFYKPHYDFDTSGKYKEEIASVKSKQKEMISSKTAISCATEWALEGSKTKGRAMTNRGIRLTARAFNNECDSAISNVSWNNAARMEQRVEKAFDAINKLNESTAIKISPQYLQLKIEELRLAQEYKEKKQQEKEEQAEIRRQMREETKLEQEKEKALKEEERYQKLLDKAKAEAEKATGAKLEKLQETLTSLGKELEEAHAKSERAKSMAQQTKAGHIYVISNIGSFGENVYKIGMTRRLEPLDRVKELGDASVPFIFDVHAIIYSDDAPNMEKSIHNAFDTKRLNLVNNRKEFFNVRLEDIEKEVKQISSEAEFILTAEARDYRQSNAIRAQREQVKTKGDIRDEFPEAI